LSEYKEISRKKVLFIGPYPPPYSGPELGMKQFLESSLQDRFEIVFLKTNFRTSNEKKGSFDYQMVLAFFVFFYRLVLLLIRNRPNVAYYPITPTQIGWVGRDTWCLLVCRLFGVKTVIHLRGGHLRLNFQSFNKYVQKLVRFSCRKTAIAIVQADCLRDQFQGLVPDDRIRVLYQAIDAKEYSAPDISVYNPRRILFMGHMTQAKGYCDLVRAIPLVAEKFPDVLFTFAGTIRKGERGVFFNQINGEPLTYEDPFAVHDEISNSKYKDNYEFLGIVSGQEKLDLIADTNIFVLPSYSEGFSRALLECIAMGKPVICTPVGAHREVIKNEINGIVVDPGDVQGIAKGIVKLFDDPVLRDNIARNNVQYAHDCFSIEIIAGQLGDLIESIL
jgi:glycosyltransferase involved in cell wall biosynthesis